MMGGGTAYRGDFQRVRPTRPTGDDQVVIALGPLLLVRRPVPADAAISGVIAVPGRVRSFVCCAGAPRS